MRFDGIRGLKFSEVQCWRGGLCWDLHRSKVGGHGKEVCLSPLGSRTSGFGRHTDTHQVRTIKCTIDSLLVSVSLPDLSFRRSVPAIIEIRPDNPENRLLRQHYECPWLRACCNGQHNYSLEHCRDGYLIIIFILWISTVTFTPHRTGGGGRKSGHFFQVSVDFV